MEELNLLPRDKRVPTLDVHDMDGCSSFQSTRTVAGHLKTSDISCVLRKLYGKEYLPFIIDQAKHFSDEIILNTRAYNFWALSNATPPARQTNTVDVWTMQAKIFKGRERERDKERERNQSAQKQDNTLRIRWEKLSSMQRFRSKIEDDLLSVKPL